MNRDKSAVDRPWNRKFLGYTVNINRQPKLKVAPQLVKRLQGKLRPMLRRGRGCNLRRVVASLLHGYTQLSVDERVTTLSESRMRESNSLTPAPM